VLDKSFDKLDYFFLLTSGEFGYLFENLPILAGGPFGSFPAGDDPDEVIGGRSESFRQSADLFSPERNIPPFPGGDYLLGYAEPFGQFHLS
jgi:hypothetical protein